MRALRLAAGTPRRTAAECEARLEASTLYRQRTDEARMTQVMSRVRALWYLDERYKERYW